MPLVKVMTDMTEFPTELDSTCGSWWRWGYAIRKQSLNIKPSVTVKFTLYGVLTVTKRVTTDHHYAAFFGFLEPSHVVPSQTLFLTLQFYYFRLLTTESYQRNHRVLCNFIYQHFNLCNICCHSTRSSLEHLQSVFARQRHGSLHLIVNNL